MVLTINENKITKKPIEYIWSFYFVKILYDRIIIQLRDFATVSKQLKNNSVFYNLPLLIWHRSPSVDPNCRYVQWSFPSGALFNWSVRLPTCFPSGNLCFVIKRIVFTKFSDDNGIFFLHPLRNNDRGLECWSSLCPTKRFL